MKELYFVVIFAAAVLFFQMFSQSFPETFSSKDLQTREVPNHVTDPELTPLYRRIHMLEKVMRLRIAQNNDYAGGDKGTPMEDYTLADIEKEINEIKATIAERIREKRYIRMRPTLYSDNPMPGVPSHPGAVDPYFHYMWY